MQQALPPAPAPSSRFRDGNSNSNDGSLHSNNNMAGRRSTVAFSPSDHLDNIFQAVRQQVERWGENAKWKIELILLSDQHATGTGATNTATTGASLLPPPPPPPPLMHHQHHHQQHHSHPHQHQHQHQQDITRPQQSETWSMPYAADLQHNLRSALDKVKYLEGVVRAQDERLRQPQGNGSLHTIQNIHTTMVNELKKQHRVEMKLLQKENQTLAKKFMRISCTLQRIEKMGLAPENAQLDVKDLREERRVLMRKLHLTELRLRARDAELNYLHSLAWSKQQRHQPSDDDDTGDHDDHDDEQLHKHDKSNNDTIVGRLSPSAYLLQKQSSPVLQPKQQQKQATTTGNRPISALDSLSILADQMLSDPDFGSEGKESSASPECDSATPTTALMTAYPQQSLHELHKRNEQHYRYVEKGNTSAATTSPVRIKKEVNGRETPSSTPSVLPYNKRKRGGDDQQQQQQQPLSPLGYYNNYHHGNVMPYYRGGRKVEELNNESSVMRPSSAFHTIIPIHHPQSKHRHQGTTIPPVNIVPRPLLPPSSMTTKDKVIGTSNTAAAAATTSGLPLGTLMSPVPSSAYHHHPSYHHQQQSYNSNQHHLHYHQHHHINDLSPASSTEENRKRRWSLDMSENKKKNSPPQPM